MAEVNVSTSYGQITVKDCVLDTDGTNLSDGIEVYDDCGAWWFDVQGVSTSDVEDNPEYLEKLINSNAF